GGCAGNEKKKPTSAGPQNSVKKRSVTMPGVNTRARYAARRTRCATGLLARSCRALVRRNHTAPTTTTARYATNATNRLANSQSISASIEAVCRKTLQEVNCDSGPQSAAQDFP